MKTHIFILLLLFIPKLLVGQENTHAFAHRGMGLSTAAPLKKGTLNYYNYYLFYNEFEFAPTNRFSFSVGTPLVPQLIEYDEWYIVTRLRYAISINERFSWAISYQNFFYLDIEFDDYESNSALLSTATYISPKFIGSIYGGHLYNSYERQRIPAFGGNLLWLPSKKQHFGLCLEYGYGEGRDPNPFRSVSGSGQILGFGPQFGGKRWALQVFGFGFYEEDYGWEWIPGISLRVQLKKPKVQTLD